MHSLTQSSVLVHSFMHSFIHFPILSSSHLSLHAFTHTLSHSLHLFIRLRTHSLAITHPSLIHSLTHPRWPTRFSFASLSHALTSEGGDGWLTKSHYRCTLHDPFVNNVASPPLSGPAVLCYLPPFISPPSWTVDTSLILASFDPSCNYVQSDSKVVSLCCLPPERCVQLLSSLWFWCSVYLYVSCFHRPCSHEL